MWVRGAGAGPLAWLLPQARCGHELQRAPAGGAGLTAAPAQAPGWGGAAHLPGSALPVRSWEKLAACAPRSPGSPKQPADLARLFQLWGGREPRGPSGAEPQHPAAGQAPPAPLSWVRWRPRSGLAAEALPACAAVPPRPPGSASGKRLPRRQSPEEPRPEEGTIKPRGQS